MFDGLWLKAQGSCLVKGAVLAPWPRGAPNPDPDLGERPAPFAMSHEP